jgi:hypothetical protein
MKNKTVRSFEVINHGVEHSQYFQGCGLAFTRFEDVATGIGDSPFEALEDALESLAQNNWDVSAVVNDLPKDSDLPEAEDDDAEPSEVYHYVSVRVSEKTASELEEVS